MSEGRLVWLLRLLTVLLALDSGRRAFALALAFLAYPGKRGPKDRVPLLDWALALLGAQKTGRPVRLALEMEEATRLHAIISRDGAPGAIERAGIPYTQLARIPK